jgi:hypothetical protein
VIELVQYVHLINCIKWAVDLEAINEVDANKFEEEGLLGYPFTLTNTSWKFS